MRHNGGKPPSGRRWNGSCPGTPAPKTSEPGHSPRPTGKPLIGNAATGVATANRHVGCRHTRSQDFRVLTICAHICRFGVAVDAGSLAEEFRTNHRADVSHTPDRSSGSPRVGTLLPCPCRQVVIEHVRQPAVPLGTRHAHPPISGLAAICPGRTAGRRSRGHCARIARSTAHGPTRWVSTSRAFTRSPLRARRAGRMVSRAVGPVLDPGAGTCAQVACPGTARPGPAGWR